MTQPDATLTSHACTTRSLHIEEGWEIDPVDLAAIAPYITSKVRRFGT